MIADDALAKFQGYVDGVLDGSITVCRSVRGAVERHVRDLEKQNSGDFPFYFNEKVAAKAISFFPTVLCHSIGVSANLPFILEPWQAFGIGCIYGWKQSDDDCRRFRRIYWAMGRKNGKSTLAAGMAILGATADWNPITECPEQVPEIYLTATKKEQAEVIYREVCRMRERSKWIRCRSEVKLNKFHASDTQGFIQPLGSDRPFDGLNPHMVIMDEVHSWTKTQKAFYDTMLTSVGNRAQPLIATVTTAGDNKSDIWQAEYKYATGVARNEIQDERFFALSYELDQEDDLLDESTWIKANPNLGVSLNLEFLRDMARPAATDSLAHRRFDNYHANRPVGSTAGAFSMEQWDACEGTLSDWADSDVTTAAVDLGARDDLAAWALVARFPTEQVQEDGTPVWRYEVRTQSYLAEDTKRNLEEEPFRKWCYENLIKVSRYPLSVLEDDVVEACHAHYVTDLAYDPYNGQQFAENVEQRGINVASYSQTCAMFHEPIVDFRQAMADGRLTHDGNPLLRWCIGNAVLVADRHDRYMFGKRDSSEKIDPVVAIVMAYRLAMIAPPRARGALFTYGSN